VNGESAAFLVFVTDNGQSGDFFVTYVTASEPGGHTEAGTLGGGNIDVRPMCAALASQAL
jgi:hypothetical protein